MIIEKAGDPLHIPLPLGVEKRMMDCRRGRKQSPYSTKNAQERKPKC